MNSKNISKSLTRKMEDWKNSIKDPNVQEAVKRGAIITGGAFVSLLNNESPNDYDIYFKTKEDLLIVVKYYVAEWKKEHDHHEISVIDENDRIKVRIKSAGAVFESDEESGIDDDTEPFLTENEESPTEQNPDIDKPKYRPRYITTNAISLSDKIQIVIRFFGSVEEIHSNYDFTHTTCSYNYENKEVILPAKALECIITKELQYQGSKYPLASIIRTRKFINRGWFVNAGQYLKMCLQLNELNLKDLSVFEDQLVGVDSAYFSVVIGDLKKKKENEPNFEIDNSYLFSIINKIF